jgi:3-hydroxybutyrate dehydrogenase
MSGQLDGRVALVTGGTRGLGRAIADAFLREGARVMVTGRSEEKGRQALADFGAGGAASPPRLTPVATMSDQDWLDTLDLNLNHVFWGMRRALRHMIPQRHGRMLVNCAVEGKLGRPGAAGYAAAMHAVTGLVKSVAHEVGTLGITVNAILPGVLAPCAQPGPDLPGRSLIERPNTFDEVASVAVLLASPSMASITGCRFAVDGGTMPY